MSTISLGMIVRNEGRTLERCLESVKDQVDEIVIGLAGQSTDDTAQIARKYTDKVFDIEWHDDFSEARNLVLSKCTGDYFLWLDGDDELIMDGGHSLHELIVANPSMEAFYWGYDYSRDENGVNNCYLIRERLIRLSPEWSWIGKVHEVFSGPADHTRMIVENIIVRHDKPPDKHPVDRNLSILYAQLEEQEPNPDPRILSYLGSENATRGNVREAINHWQRFIQLSGWDEEKYQAQHKIADAWRALNELEKSRQADFAAIRIRSDWPDAYFGLAETAYRAGAYTEAIEWTKSGSTKNQPRTFLILNPRDYDYDPLIIVGLAYTQLGDYESAIGNFIQAYAVKSEESLGKQIHVIQEEYRLHQIVDYSVKIWEELVKNDEWLKARAFLESLPHSIQQTPPIQSIRGLTFQSTAHVETPELMEGLYLNNPHWEPMNETQIEAPEWLQFPRMAFALETAKAIGATNVIDLGCSDGFIALPLARELPRVQVTGIDLDPRCVQLANQRVKSWGLPHTDFFVGNVDTHQSDVKHFYDLALIFEVLEHVVDPNKTLDKIEKLAKHVAITTPYLAWELGRVTDHQNQELKGHLRIFDLDDMERMLAPRGRIRDLYKQPFGESSWIFADYQVGSTTEKSVAIYAGGTFESWSPQKLKLEGLGGSETAVIRVAEELAKLGHQVTVYCDTDSPGYFNYVRYREQEKFHPSIRADLFIAWRAPELADLNVNARHKVLWMHDTDAGDRLTATRAAAFDKIQVLTEWHKTHMIQMYDFLRDEQFIVLGNGVDLERFEGTEEREPHRVVYASSPDRGLDFILEGIWPRVIEAVPDAELHVYYGWTSFDKAAEQFPQLRDFKSKILDLLNKTRNVVQHGRINQKQLAREFMKSSFWLYPTHFSETYCITAVEAQLAGCIPVTNHLAALSETAKSGIFIDGDVTKPEIQAGFATELIKYLRMTDLDKYRESVKLHAPQLTWADVASEWTAQFLEAGNGPQ